MRKLLFFGFCGLILSGCNSNVPTDYSTITEYIDQNITQIVEEGNFKTSPANGKWFADGFGFTNADHVYVDFEDGHYLFRALLECTKKAENIQCTALGFFEPNKEKWLLLQGEDNQRTNPIVWSWVKNQDYEWQR